MLLMMSERVCCRDFYLTIKDVTNLAAELDAVLWRLAAVDAESVRLWVERNPRGYFLYEPGSGGGSCDFLLGMQDPWQKHRLMRHGHGRAVFLDTTHGTNKNKVRLTLVFYIRLRLLCASWSCSSVAAQRVTAQQPNIRKQC